MGVSSLITEGLGKSGGGTLQVTSVVASPLSVTINFNANVLVTSDSVSYLNWSITPNGGGAIPVTISSMNVSGSTITLNATEGTVGGSYTLHIPFGVLNLDDGSNLIPPYTYIFTGNGVAPAITMIVDLNDGRKIDVVYTESVNESDALVATNYVFVPTLNVSSVSKVSDNRYTVFTVEAQIPGQSYNLTVSNVRDLAGNLI
jgi:hypothetical protein